MKVGVIADTHGLLRQEAEAALADSTVILHAGDIGKGDILERLEAIAPVVAIRGNIDTSGRAADLPDSRVIKLAGHRILLLHDLKALDADAAKGCAVIVAGHSHKPRNEVIDTVLFFNPGAAGRKRFRLPITVGCLTLTPVAVSGTIICLDV